MIKAVFEGLYQEGEVFSCEEIISFLDKHPEIQNLNRQVKQKTLVVSD
jgi:spore coat polysaccharide biosynthesis protein SpsF (cytidylyltransferase family)